MRFWRTLAWSTSGSLAAGIVASDIIIRVFERRYARMFGKRALRRAELKGKSC